MSPYIRAMAKKQPETTYGMAMNKVPEPSPEEELLADLIKPELLELETEPLS